MSPLPLAFAAALLAWYDAGNRDLPWRREPSPYRTLVSEIMLQQTVVATVIAYFHRFVQQLPTFQALAEAREEEVFSLWSGLGYYRRARNLQRAAQAVVQVHGGILPADEDQLRALPGVGPYTAAALGAIVHGRRTFALDGNAARVMARLFAYQDAFDTPGARQHLHARGLALVPPHRSGDFAQAVMELGSQICRVGTPRCDQCPVSRHCQALSSGQTTTLPRRTPRRSKKVVRLVCLAAEQAGHVLLVRREEGTLLAGTWALPAEESASGSSDEGVCRKLLAGLGFRASLGGFQRSGEIRHIFTHRDVTAHVWRITVTEKPPSGGMHPEKRRWIRADAPESVALSAFSRKTLTLVT